MLLIQYAKIKTGIEEQQPFDGNYHEIPPLKKTSLDHPHITFTAYVEYDPATKLYVGYIVTGE